MAKYQKILNVVKIRNYDGVFFRKKRRFHLFKSLLYKNGKAQNMPVVAGRLFILRHIYNMEAKSSAQWDIPDVFLPYVCQLRSRQHSQFVLVWT